jgi:hypothetical protein
MRPHLRSPRAHVFLLLLIAAWLPSLAAALPRSSPERAASTDGRWIIDPPPGERYLHTAIHDPLGHRMVVFGGGGGFFYLNDVWALALSGAPFWSSLAPSGTPPSGRQSHTAIDDPAGDRMIVFGGGNGSGVFGDVWALSLSGSPAWTQLAPAGTPPSPRADHSAIYDPIRQRMVVFGGCDFSGGFQDVWVLSLAGTPEWTELAPAGTPPSARCGHVAVYDPVRDRMVVFGGNDLLGFPAAGTWALSLGENPEWIEITPAGTPPIDRVAVDYDPVGDRIVAVGGTALSGGLAVSELSLAGPPTWTSLAPAGTAPGGRYFHSAIYDPGSARMVVFAGDGFGYPFHDTWALALGGTQAWASLDVPTTGPGVRYGHSAIFDPPRDRMVVFGGIGIGYTNEVWACALAGNRIWTKLTPAGTPPNAQTLHSAIYDPVRDRMIVVGTGDGLATEAWVLSLDNSPTWTHLTPAGLPPSARPAHTTIYDPLRDRLIVFGGQAGSDEVWAMTLAGGPAWTQLMPEGTLPTGRQQHAAIYDPVHDRMVVFGGQEFGHYYDDVWALSLEGTPEWTQLAPGGTPPAARSLHDAIYDPLRGRMIVYGGGSNAGQQLYDDAWSLSLDGSTAWTKLAPAGTPPKARIFHTAIYDAAGDGMVVFGGYGFSYFVDMGTLEFDDVVTPTLLSLVSAEAEAGVVKLKWFAGGPISADIQRRTPTSGWLRLASSNADAGGMIVYEDHAVDFGHRYGYRVGIPGQNGEQFFGETWVTMPGSALSLEAPYPNPADRELFVSCSLPIARPAAVDLVDLAGRIVAHYDVGPEAGRHLIHLKEGPGLAPGVYLLRLTQGAHSAIGKVCVVH